MPAEDGSRKGHARPHETVQRIKSLQAYWGTRRLSEVNGDTCREYWGKRSSVSAARRELEELRAANNHCIREGLCDKLVSVKLPDKSPPRERWLTKQEAAALIRAAWRYREQQNYRGTDRRTRRHIARWMVVASYMGSRTSVICEASIEPKRPHGRAWVDLSTGMFHGRPYRARKTKKRRQQLRVPPPLLAHMRRWRRNGQRHVVEWNGKPVTRIKTAYDAVVADVGLDDVTQHTWRHTLATWLMINGADPWRTADFLAMSYETLLRVYGHYRPDDADDIHDPTMRRRNRQCFANDKREQKRIPGHSNASEMPVKSTFT